MSLYTWLRGIIHGTESTESPGNTNSSNNPCGGRETPSSEGGPRRIDLEAADKLIAQALPLIDELEERGEPYAIVGGLAVLLQARNAGFTTLRATYDIDIMVADQRSFPALARIRDAEARKNGIDVPPLPSGAFHASPYPELNESLPAILGGHESFGIGIDSVTSLHGFDIDSLETELLPLGNRALVVATPEQLLEMKRRTVRLLSSTAESSSRPQDLIDISALEKIISRKASFEACNAKEKELSTGGDPRNAVACDLRPLRSDQKRKAR